MLPTKGQYSLYFTFNVMMPYRGLEALIGYYGAHVFRYSIFLRNLYLYAFSKQITLLYRKPVAINVSNVYLKCLNCAELCRTCSNMMQHLPRNLLTVSSV